MRIRPYHKYLLATLLTQTSACITERFAISEHFPRRPSTNMVNEETKMFCKDQVLVALKNWDQRMSDVSIGPTEGTDSLLLVLLPAASDPKGYFQLRYQHDLETRTSTVKFSFFSRKVLSAEQKAMFEKKFSLQDLRASLMAAAECVGS